MHGSRVSQICSLEKEFERYGLAVSRQHMANWMIRLGEGYLGVMYDHLHRLLYDYHVIRLFTQMMENLFDEIFY